MKRPAELDDKDRRGDGGKVNAKVVIIGPPYGIVDPVDVVRTALADLRAADAVPTPTPTPPPAFPWRRFLSRLAWWAVLTMAGAFVAAEVWP